jgi:hypothetical protein
VGPRRELAGGKVWESVRKFSGLKLFGWNNPHELRDETGTGSRGKRDSDKDTGLRSAGKAPLIIMTD